MPLQPGDLSRLCLGSLAVAGLRFPFRYAPGVGWSSIIADVLRGSLSSGMGDLLGLAIAAAAKLLEVRLSRHLRRDFSGFQLRGADSADAIRRLSSDDALKRQSNWRIWRQ